MSTIELKTTRLSTTSVQSEKRRSLNSKHHDLIKQPSVNSGSRAHSLLSSVYTQFNFVVFIQQLLIHLFYPFFNWLSPNRTAQALTLIPPNIESFIFTQLMPFLLYLMIISHYFLLYYGQSPESTASKSLDKVGNDILFPLMYFCIHKVIVAYKYASLSETEYKRIMSVTNNEDAMYYQNQLQLRTSLSNIGATIEFEIAAAAARAGMDVQDEELYFVIRNPAENFESLEQMRKWIALLKIKKYNPDENDDIFPHQITNFKDTEHYKVSIYEVVLALLLKTEKDQKKDSGFYIILFLNFLSAGVPLIQIVNADDTRENTWLNIFAATSTIINIIYFNVTYIFLRLSYEQTNKSFELAKNLNSFLRLFDEDLLPCLKFKSPKEADTESSSHDIQDYLQRNSNGRFQSFSDSLSGFIHDHSATSVKQRRSTAGFDTRGESLASKDGSILESNILNDENNKAFSVVADAQEANTYGVSRDKDQIENLIPMLNLLHPENIMTWYYCQRMFTRYGERTCARLEFNILLLVFVVFVLMAAVITSLVSHNNPSPLDLITNAALLQALIATSIIYVFVLLSVYSGSNVNDTRQDSLNILSSQLLKSRYNLLKKGICVSHQSNNKNIDDEVIDEIQSNDCIRYSIDGLRSLYNSNPYKVLMVPAQFSLLSAILTGIVSFYSAVFGLIFKNASSTTSSSATY